MKKSFVPPKNSPAALLARYIYPHGEQNFSEIRSILEKNPPFASQLDNYLFSRKQFLQKLLDPKTPLQEELIANAKRLDTDLDTLVQHSPDERITSYLICQGHLTALPFITEDVKNQRHKIIPAERAAQYMFPEGDEKFEELLAAFNKDIFYTGEFNGLEEAFEMMRNELLLKQKKIDARRLALFDELKRELVKKAPHSLIQKHLEKRYQQFQELNKKAK